MQNSSESGRNSVKNNVDYSLYLCTDRRLMTTDTVERSVELAVQGGCTVVQLLSLIHI